MWQKQMVVIGLLLISATQSFAKDLYLRCVVNGENNLNEIMESFSEDIDLIIKNNKIEIEAINLPPRQYPVKISDTEIHTVPSKKIVNELYSVEIDRMTGKVHIYGNMDDAFGKLSWKADGICKDVEKTRKF